jgi:hypothetical protein
MKIYVVSSMNHSEKMLEAKKELEKLGHEVLVSEFVDEYIGKDAEERERLKTIHKNENRAIKRFWERFQNCDAILVLNLDKSGVKNYIGGSTFLEIGFAYVMDKKIFMMNPIPENPLYKSEIETTKPIVINGDLTKIK